MEKRRGEEGRGGGGGEKGNNRIMLKPCFPSSSPSPIPFPPSSADAADFIAGDIDKLRLLIIANYL